MLIIFLAQIAARIIQIVLDLALINNNQKLYGIIAFFQSIVEYAPPGMYQSIGPLFIVDFSIGYDSRQMLSTILGVTTR